MFVALESSNFSLRCVDRPQSQSKITNANINPALNEIGLNILDQYFELLVGITSVPIVSVGSGNGYVERHIEKKFGRQIYCVDPKKYDQMDQSVYKTSEYDNVTQLLLSKPELTSHSITFINWSYPYDSSEWSYDYQAIKTLESDHVLIVFESSGIAGSTILHKWLKYCDRTNTTDEERILCDFPLYFIVTSTIACAETIFGFAEFKIIWLSKNIINIDTHKIPHDANNI